MKENNKNVEIDQLKDGVFFAGRGGGIRSCVSIGVLKALEEANIPIKGVSGESLSSIFAVLLAYGYNSDEILELFLKYNETFTKAAKIYGGIGSLVIEEVVNQVTNCAYFKDLNIDCYVNACYGNLLKPKLFLFSKETTPNEQVGVACRASASLPVLYGNCDILIGDQEYSFFDGGFLYNPYIPETKYPIIYASFHNYIDYYKIIPGLRRTIIASNKVANVIVYAPVGKILITGSNEEMIKAYESGYEQTKKVLKL